MTDLIPFKQDLSRLEDCSQWPDILLLMRDEARCLADPQYAALMFDTSLVLAREAYGYAQDTPMGQYAEAFADVTGWLYTLLREHHRKDAWCLWRLGEALAAGPGYLYFVSNTEIKRDLQEWRQTAVEILEESLQIKESLLSSMEYNRAAYNLACQQQPEAEPRFLTLRECDQAERELADLHLQGNWADDALKDYCKLLIGENRKREYVS